MTLRLLQISDTCDTPFHVCSDSNYVGACILPLNNAIFYISRLTGDIHTYTDDLLA